MKEIEDCYIVYSGVRDGRAKTGAAVFFSKVKHCLLGCEVSCGELCLDLSKLYMGVCGTEGRQFTDSSEGDSVAFCRSQVFFIGRYVKLDHIRDTNCHEETKPACKTLMQFSSSIQLST